MITKYEYPVVTFSRVNAGTRPERVKQWLQSRMSYLRPGQILRIPHKSRIPLPKIGWFRKKDHHPWGGDIAVLNRADAIYIISMPNGNEPESERCEHRPQQTLLT